MHEYGHLRPGVMLGTLPKPLRSALENRYFLQKLCQIRHKTFARWRYCYRMKVVFSHNTALFLLRLWSMRHAIPLNVFHSLRSGATSQLPARSLRTSRSLSSCAATMREVGRFVAGMEESSLKKILTGVFDGPPLGTSVHLLVPSRPGTHSNERITFHQMKEPLPIDALLKLAPGVCCASPELAFVQMGTALDKGAHIALGYELCGCYPIKDRPAMVRAPLTTPQRLDSFIRRAEGIRGVCQARMAARHVRARSASVMETEVSALALTSKKWGGYGLPNAQLNAVVKLSEKAALIARSSYLVVDLLWPDHAVALEYDGAASHEGPSRLARDSRRRDALAAQGINLTTVTSGQFSSIDEFGEIMAHIEHKVGRKPSPKPSTFQASNFALREQMRIFHNDAWF